MNSKKRWISRPSLLILTVPCVTANGRSLVNPNHALIEYLQEWKRNGNKLILWTCRAGEALSKAVEWCREQNLEFDKIPYPLSWISVKVNSYQCKRKVWVFFYK